MYHISNDSRAKRSAELIRMGLEECLKEKSLPKIRVSDIYEKSFVSRATFYRLFDCIEDIFLYECDAIRADTVKIMATKQFGSSNQQAIYCIKRWLEHETLMKAMVDNNLFGIFLESHRRNAEILKKMYSNVHPDEKHFEYFVSILASMIFGTMTIYFRNGASEPIEEVYKTFCHCTGVIASKVLHIEI